MSTRGRLLTGLGLGTVMLGMFSLPYFIHRRQKRLTGGRGLMGSDKPLKGSATRRGNYQSMGQDVGLDPEFGGGKSRYAEDVPGDHYERAQVSRHRQRAEKRSQEFLEQQRQAEATGNKL